MSRIGRQPINLPAKVTVAVDGTSVSVAGPRGSLVFKLPGMTEARLEGSSLLVLRQGESAEARARHGLARSVLSNMVRGVTDGYCRRLEIHGVGFKAAVQAGAVNLVLGYSHPVSYRIPPQVKVTVDENTKITIEGPDKQVVGQVAADL